MEPLASVIVIHGYQGRPDVAWKPWLKYELESEQVVAKLPAMPEPNHPVESAWLDMIDTQVIAAKTPIILVGHSLGGLAVLRWLETRAIEPIHAAICIGGVVTPKKYSGTFAHEWSAPTDWENIRQFTNHLVGIYGRDDSSVTFDEGKLLEQNGQATLLVVEGYGHFSPDDGVTQVPELLQTIDSLIQLAK